jgi:integrase
MPRRAKGPRLYLDPKRQEYVIRDRAVFIRTGFAASQDQQAHQSLANYIHEKYEPKASASPLIEDVLNAYMNDIVPNLRSAKNTGYNLRLLDAWWHGKHAADVTPQACRAYAKTKTPDAAAGHLKVLQSALRHWHAEYGPLPTLPRVWRPKAGGRRERWLTRNEAARLLKASRRVPYLARMILLGLHTGSRPGVTLALEWSWIDLQRGIMHRKAQGARDYGNKRSPPVKLGRKIMVHLRRWKRLDAGKQTYVVHYHGKRILDTPHGSWARAVKDAGLVGRVTPHTLRHTRATWMMQRGVSPWAAAGFLGMSVRVLESVYGHHSPAFQADAADI